MRIVVKIGTSTLAHKTGLLNIRRVEELCKVMSDLKNAGNEVILVSSGAIGMGVGKLSLNESPPTYPQSRRLRLLVSASLCILMISFSPNITTLLPSCL